MSSRQYEIPVRRDWIPAGIVFVFSILAIVTSGGQTGAPASDTKDSITADQLRTSALVNPVGLDRDTPTFGWQLAVRESSSPEVAQSAYRLLVASSPALLTPGKADMWDSGRVPSANRLQIVYGGKPLRSHTTYFWTVQVWDSQGRPSAWSSPTKWTTALLHVGDWRARWIAAEPDQPLESQALEGRGKWTEHVGPLPMFRDEFRIEHPVRQAIVYVSGLGQYELRLNGTNVTETALNPGWTNYRKTVLYNSYDVTDRLRPGGNALGVMLGNGMYNVQGVHGRYTKFIGSFGQPKLILQMHLLYKDGTEDVIVSDQSWKTTSGPIVFSSPYGGEDFDARQEPVGWDRPGFADKNWVPALEVAGPDGDLREPGKELSGAKIPPITVAEMLKPTNVRALKPGVQVYDLGKNSSGWPEIVVRGHAGDRIQMLPGELLNPDGSVTQRSGSASPSDPVLFTYILSGKGEERWHPRFSYYGFRYVQVERTPAESGGPAPEILSLQGDFIHDDVTVDGHFSSDVPLLNDIHGLIDRAILSNSMSVLTDCPTREKLGWLEQTHLAGASIMYNYDVQALYAKTVRDMAEAQLPNGFVPAIAPEYVAFVDRNGVSTNFRDSPEWGSALILDPWQIYEFYGNAEILKTYYPAMVRYAEYLHSRLQDGMLVYGLGDWFDVGPNVPGESQLTSKGLTATAIYYRDLQVLANAARLLRRDSDAQRFASEAESTRNAFNRHLFHAETGIYDRGSQTAQAMPLVLGLVPEAARAAVLANLVGDIRAHQNHVTAGDIGFHYVVRALTDAGRSDVVFDMLSRTDSPSYGYQLARGATTLTEAWNTDPRSSQNHFMLGHAEEWFYRGLAGVDFDMSRPAQKRIELHPSFVPGVSNVHASFLSVMGTVESFWERSGDEIRWTVTLPAGTQGTVVFPSGADAISLDGKPLGPPDSYSAGLLLRSGQHRLLVALKQVSAAAPHQ